MHKPTHQLTIIIPLALDDLSVDVVGRVIRPVLDAIQRDLPDAVCASYAHIELVRIGADDQTS